MWAPDNLQGFILKPLPGRPPLQPRLPQSLGHRLLVPPRYQHTQPVRVN